MKEELNEEVILRQLRDSYTPMLIFLTIVFMIAGGTGIYLLFRFGLWHIGTICALAVAAILLILTLYQLYKWIFVEKSPILEPFGNAIAMAGCIRAGGTFAIWQTPPARKHSLIITEDYIVCPERVQSYLPLSEIMGVRRCVLDNAGFLRCLFRARSLSAAAEALSIKHSDRVFWKSHPQPDTERFDLLVLRDHKRHVHHYFVSVADFHDVLAFLREYQPEAVFKADKKA